MAFLSKPSKTGSPSIRLHDRDDPSIVHYDSADEKDASKHQVLWSNLMNKGNYLVSSDYHNVEVLLLCWDEKCVDLATQEEVDQLKAVWEVSFGYHATIAKLLPKRLEPRGRKIQVQVNCKVAEFVNDYDGPNNLLIVYYAGHGKPGPLFGDLELFGQTSPNDPRDNLERQLDKLVWNKTEGFLREAEATILQIFDCCYAGTLGLTRGDDRAFEFLAAAQAHQATPVPGKESFTSALIYALKKLVDETTEGRFTTAQLLEKIKNHAPHFPKDQDPLLAERGDSHTQAGRIMLHPIRRDGTVSQSSKQKLGIDQTKKHTVTLHFDFTSQPSEGNLETLGKGINDMFRRNNLEVLPPRWGGMRPSATVRALNRFQASLRRRRSSNNAEKRPILEEQSSPDSQLAPLRERDLCPPLTPPGSGYHTQDSAHTADYVESRSADSSGNKKDGARSKPKRRKIAKEGDNI